MDEVKFSEWMEEITRGSDFPRQKVPTDKELSSMSSVKSLTPVLQYLVKHVRPSEERQHIKLNLKNYNRKKHLSEERKMSDTQKKLAQLKFKVQEAEKEVQTEADDLKRIVEEEEKLVLEENNTRCKLALLQISCEDREEKIKTFKNRSRAISEVLPKTKPLLSPQEESMNHNAAMEDIEFILQKIITLKKSELDNQEIPHESKVEIWKLVEEMMECYSASTLYRALSCKILHEVDTVTDAINSVNLLEDAKALNLEYQSNGAFVDILNPHGILETVESMLLQMNAKHIQKHLAYCKQKQKVKLTSESLTEVKNNIESVLNEQYKDNSIVLAISDLLNTTVSIAGLKASLATAHALKEDLEKREETAKKGKELILEKYNRIHNFQENLKRAVTELQSLVFGSHTSMDELEHRRSNISVTVDEKLKDLTLPTPFLKGAFSKESEAILNIPHQILRTFSPNYSAPQGHSIGPIEDSSSDLAELSSLVPFVSPWENIIEMSRQTKLKLQINENMLSDKSKVYDKMAKTYLNENLSLYEVKAMQQKVKLHDEQLEAEIGKILNKSEETNKNVEDTLKKLNNAIDDWWTQPGTEVKKYIEEKY